MLRYRLIIEYDGGPFQGWQRQDSGPTVQEALETAIMQFSGEPVTVFGAGRTDSGVHARGQVAHFDLQKDVPADTVRNALNHHLRPQPISVLDVAVADPEFHARFDAVGRHYLYRIINRPTPLALDVERAWRVPRLLDYEAMAQAAEVLVGHHDFTTFRSTRCQAKSPVKTLDVLNVTSAGETIGDMNLGQTIEIRASARSFLHNQVRSMAGSLKLVGEGRWTPQDMRDALEACDRKACGPVAPPDGLYLLQVDYD